MDFLSFHPCPPLGLRIIQRVYGNVWVLKTLGDQTFMCVFSRHTNVPSDPEIGHICLVSLWRHCTCGEFFCISPPFGLEGTVPLILRFLMIKHSKKVFFLNLIIFILHVWMLCLHVCVPHVYLVPAESGRFTDDGWEPACRSWELHLGHLSSPTQKMLKSSKAAICRRSPRKVSNWVLNEYQEAKAK